MFIHRERHLSSTATHYCHPLETCCWVERAGRLGEDYTVFLRVVNLKVNNLSSCLCFRGPCVLTQRAALSGALRKTSRSNIFVSDQRASTHLHQPRESLPDLPHKNHVPFPFILVTTYNVVSNLNKRKKICKYMDRARFKM